MAAEIVSFGRPVANADVLEQLREITAKAERGEVQAFAAALVYEDGSSDVASSGTMQSRGPVTYQALIGAVTILLHRLVEMRPR